MIVTAYQCEKCEGVYTEEYVLGLIVNNPNLFGNYDKYTSTDKIDKCNIHFCLSCYNRAVTDLLKGINRETDEQDYIFHNKLYSQKFYEAIHIKASLHRKPNNRRPKTLF